MEPGQITLIFSLFSAAATAVWTVWTWSEQQKTEITLEQDQIAALYVNPFILAAGLLTNHLYEMLQKHALAGFKKTYPETYELGSPAAFETLYFMASYFAWEYYIYRYGPYKKDSKTYQLVTKVAETFADRQYPGEAFRFSPGEQLALGKFAIQPAPAPATHEFPEYETIPLYQFVETIKKELHDNASLAQFKTIQRTLEAIDQAEQVEQLEGYERLVKVQDHLAKLVDYLETQQGLTTTTSRKPRLSNNLSAAPQPVDLPQILHRLQGRVRLRVPDLRYNEAYAKQLQAKVEALPGVQAVSVNLASASIVVNYNPNLPTNEFERSVLAALK